MFFPKCFSQHLSSRPYLTIPSVCTSALTMHLAGMSCYPKILQSVSPRPTWCRRLSGGTSGSSRAKDGCIIWSISQVFCLTNYFISTNSPNRTSCQHWILIPKSCAIDFSLLLLQIPFLLVSILACYCRISDRHAEVSNIEAAPVHIFLTGFTKPYLQKFWPLLDFI